MVIRYLMDEFRKAIIFAKGGSGDQAQLNAPSISLTGSVITIINPSTNGNFCDGYNLYCNGEFVTTTTETTIDIEEIPNLPTGTDSFTVRCKGSKMKESSNSNAVTYAYENCFYTVDDDAFYTVDDYEFISA